jgi:hypothetical protein
VTGTTFVVRGINPSTADCAWSTLSSGVSASATRPALPAFFRRGTRRSGLGEHPELERSGSAVSDCCVASGFGLSTELGAETLIVGEPHTATTGTMGPAPW